MFRLLMPLIFAGSVFVTSGKFVDATNTPKGYFVVIFLLAATTFIAIRQNRLNFCATENKSALWGINIICFLQACYGLCQFVGWVPSNHSEFAITGSFDNPAGFAAVMAIGFPIVLFLLVKANRIERYFVVTIMSVIVSTVFLSGSRAGMLSILISSLVFFLFQSNIISRLKLFQYYKLFSILIFVILVVGAFRLYHQKMDSANGRLLIWKVSSEMIKDKPLWGHGYGAFQSKYMDYQAEYFRNNSHSRFELLADNVKHPFNEFIKVAVEFGLVGLVVILSIILFVLWKIMKSKTEDRKFVFSGMASFLVFACFSYPLQYIAVCSLLLFYLLSLLPAKKIVVKNTPVSVIFRSVTAIVCIFLLFYVCRQVNFEIKWKTIAMKSLRGETVKMLPEYEKLYSTSLKRNPYFLYNYGAELNVVGRFDKSIEILSECKKRFNDYDLQMLLADNYHKKGETEKAIEIYRHASFMIPCRFLPIYQLFETYRKAGQKDLAGKYANEIVNKNVKIQSNSVTCFQNEAKTFLNESKL